MVQPRIVRYCAQGNQHTSCSVGSSISIVSDHYMGLIRCHWLAQVDATQNIQKRVAE